MISLNNLSVHFTGTYIFDDVSFIISDKDRIGLVGKNGAGKTTLLKIIAGFLEPEKGNVVSSSGLTIGYLPQEMTNTSKKTIYGEALCAFSEAIELEEKMKKITSEISSRSDYESEQYFNLIHTLSEINEHYQLIGGKTMHADIEKVLVGLGFMQNDFTRSVAEFSGGWQMRVELAKILLQQPNVVLLDEPTNHLDIEAIQWLEDFLIRYNGAVVMVSHDRKFLDSVTQRTIEISLGKIYDYKASYSDYVTMREERMETQVAAYNNQQKQIYDTEKFIERFRYKSTKSRQVQSRVKMLDKMKLIEIDETDNSTIHFKFPPAPHSGKVVIEAESLTKQYDNNIVFEDVNFILSKGEKVAFVGKNGEGKTTLSRIIVGELQHEGKCKLGHQVVIGYYAQNQADLLNPDYTVFETLDCVAVGEVRTKLRNILGCFLFSNNDIDKKVKVLSGGEKSRLAIARLLLTPANLLVLDEPTNHLDMRSKDILKSALLKYDGTLILVSHDRDFMQGLTNKVFEFRNKTIKQCFGDIYDFLNTRKIESLKELEKKQKIKNTKKPQLNNKINWEKKKQFEKEIKKIKNQICQCEKEIEQLEKKIKEMNEKLHNPNTYKEILNSNDLYFHYEELQKQRDIALNRWEKLNFKADEIKKSNSLIISIYP